MVFLGETGVQNGRLGLGLDALTGYMLNGHGGGVGLFYIMPL